MGNELTGKECVSCGRFKPYSDFKKMGSQFDHSPTLLRAALDYLLTFHPEEESQ